ncbi:sugar:cation symporter [Rhodosalinus halophilus]|uniref:Sugar:cation symporter n=1 Tax=Rhodosalinus halophilus TaxID=2259333 RepID=A0A365U995_9RHOB|nr:MFS transporter [Rhodosalinus halophilus]RBI85580.1 sugar:cation symporter [Rhodosalinus halophilus]
MTHRLPAYGLFAAMLAAAGLPLYIHAPKVYVDDYGVSLAALGAVLFGLRLLDVVQDPLLGRLAAALRGRRAPAVGVAVSVIAAAMVGLFAVTPPVAPLLWFALMLTAVFSAFSFLTIAFYAQGVTTATDLGQGGHLRVARWRETGALIGVCAAAVAPEALGFAGFALAFAALALAAGLSMRGEWRGPVEAPAGGFAPVLRDPAARRLLFVALVNATPVAVTSTLFLFFVESRLQAPGMEGPLLLLFFLAAALSAPFWGKAADRYGARRILLLGMGASVVGFVFALGLGAGDWPAFAVICVVTGAALGADMVVLSALFARRLETIAPGAAEAFGLWSFVTKATLALAAATLLPTLEAAGFEAGTRNDAQALWTLTILYAGVPCLLKLVAMALLATAPLGHDDEDIETGTETGTGTNTWKTSSTR